MSGPFCHSLAHAASADGPEGAQALKGAMACLAPGHEVLSPFQTRLPLYFPCSVPDTPAT